MVVLEHSQVSGHRVNGVGMVVGDMVYGAGRATVYKVLGGKLFSGGRIMADIWVDTAFGGHKQEQMAPLKREYRAVALDNNRLRNSVADRHCTNY